MSDIAMQALMANCFGDIDQLCLQHMHAVERHDWKTAEYCAAVYADYLRKKRR